MEEIELQFPDARHEERAEEYKREFFTHNEFYINGSVLLDQMSYREWLSNTVRNSHTETMRKDWVVATTFFAVRKRDDLIVGMIDIRHNLNNAFLSQYGGHIGYAVRPSDRRKGYATGMFRMALSYAKSLGPRKLMLRCCANNVAFIKTTEKCGGILLKTKPYMDGKPVRVYWIDLS